MSEDPRRVFGARVPSYVRSVSHADPATLERVCDLARPSPDALALDVATGAGHAALALSRRVRRVVGMDVTQGMLAAARALAVEQGVANVEWVEGDVHAMPFPDATFDVVTCRRGAHHFRDLPRALAEMRRVLAPRGRLVIDDRSVPEDDFADAEMNRLDVLHDPSHVRERRPSEWRRLLAHAGFAVESLETYEQSRPLSSLTQDADPRAASEIRAAFGAWTAAERATMGAVERDGEPFTTHWFVLLSAVPQGGHPAREPVGPSTASPPADAPGGRRTEDRPP